MAKEIIAAGEFDDMNGKIDKMVDAVNQQTMNIGLILNHIGDVSKRVDDISKEMEAVKSDVAELKNEEEIKTSKTKEIRRLVQRIVSRRIGVNEDPSKRTVEEKIIDKKYRSIFSSALYAQVSEKGHLASPYSATAKKDFIQACDDIEQWYPREGVDGLKKRADENALARRIAQEQGY